MNETGQTIPTSAPLESAMDTGTDDEPALTVGDKHASDLPDPNGDGVLTVAEAETLLGGDGDATETPSAAEPTNSIEGK